MTGMKTLWDADGHRWTLIAVWSGIVSGKPLASKWGGEKERGCAMTLSLCQVHDPVVKPVGWCYTKQKITFAL
jgi:hypothetical protein